MKIIELPHLGKVQLVKSDIEYYYNVEEFSITNQQIELDIHFTDLTDNSIACVANALNKLDEVITTCDVSIMNDFLQHGEAEYYITEWRDYIFEQIFSPEEFQAFLADTDAKQPLEHQLLAKLQLVRLGIFANLETDFLTLDYAFGKEYDKGFRDDMLVVRLNPNLAVTEITTEG